MDRSSLPIHRVYDRYRPVATYPRSSRHLFIELSLSICRFLSFHRAHVLEPLLTIQSSLKYLRNATYPGLLLSIYGPSIIFPPLVTYRWITVYRFPVIHRISTIYLSIPHDSVSLFSKFLCLEIEEFRAYLYASDRKN